MEEGTEKLTPADVDKVEEAEKADAENNTNETKPNVVVHQQQE